MFLQGKNIQLANLPIYSVGDNVRPDSGTLNWRVWSDWNNSRWQSAVGNFDIKNAEWLANEDKDNLEHIETFDGKFNWYFKNSTKGVFSLSEVSLKRKAEQSILLPDLYFLFNQRNRKLKSGN